LKKKKKKKKKVRVVDFFRAVTYCMKNTLTATGNEGNEHRAQMARDY